MRVIASILTFIFLLPGFAIAVDSTTGESVEATIRRLDLAEASAVLTADFDGAETTIHRRYTNIWMKRDGQWLPTARHANVICSET
ncbi:MAG TPA: hypothetical protein VLE50_01770 [Cellvibrio sp.]|nr:hypothetical protein [Cellvibrio sp.]